LISVIRIATPRGTYLVAAYRYFMGHGGPRDPLTEIRDSLVGYWGSDGAETEFGRLVYLGGGINIRVKRQTATSVVAEVDSYSGEYSGIAILTRSAEIESEDVRDALKD